MTWQVLVLLVAVLLVAGGLAAWVLWLIHDSEPTEEE